MVDPDSARALRPLRQLALPGGRTLLRAGLVAALLGLAAAVLHTPGWMPADRRALRRTIGAADPATQAHRRRRVPDRRAGDRPRVEHGLPDRPRVHGRLADRGREVWPSRRGQSQCGGRSASSQSSLPLDRSPQPRSVSSEVCSGSTTKSSLRSTARSSSRACAVRAGVLGAHERQD